MPDLAKFVYIHHKGMSIDGVEIPWYIDDFPIRASKTDDGFWKVEVSILAKDVGVSPLLNREPYEEVVVDRKE